MSRTRIYRILGLTGLACLFSGFVSCTDHERNIEAEQNAGAGSSSSSSVGADNHQPSSSSVSQNGSSSSECVGAYCISSSSSSAEQGSSSSGSSSSSDETPLSSSSTEANGNPSSSAGMDNSSSSECVGADLCVSPSSSSSLTPSSSSIAPSSSSTLSIAFCGGSTYEPSEKGCCDTALFNLSNQRCGTSNVIETKCGTNGWYDAANTSLRCENSVIETKCGTNGWYDAANTSLRCENSVIETNCGDEWYYANPAETYLCYEGTLLIQCGTVANNWYNPKVQYCQNGTMPTQYGSLEYAEQTYKTVVIGTGTTAQVWMAENLNYGTSGKCYGDDPANCNKYGRLYNWATAMNIANTYNSSLYSPTNSVKYKGICPTGWHIPNDDEWDVLVKYVDPDWTNMTTNNVAGTKLKAKNGWSSNGNGMDDYGFAALPGGSGNSDGGFLNAGNGYWWSSSENSANDAYSRSMRYNGEGAVWGYSSKTNLQSVRCVQN